jgi:hypothetical protein
MFPRRTLFHLPVLHLNGLSGRITTYPPKHLRISKRLAFLHLSELFNLWAIKRPPCICFSDAWLPTQRYRVKPQSRIKTPLESKLCQWRSTWPLLLTTHFDGSFMFALPISLGGVFCLLFGTIGSHILSALLGAVHLGWRVSHPSKWGCGQIRTGNHPTRLPLPKERRHWVNQMSGRSRVD